MKTRISELLGIRYPIIQGGMQNVAYPKLAAAVSNAGGLGTINTTIYQTPEAFHEALREMKSLTDKPFCVNMSLLPDVNVGDEIKRYIDLCGQEGVTAIETAGVKPSAIAAPIHDAGLIHIHKVPATRFGVSAQACGVDAVAAVGYECGGHPGMDGIGTIVLANECSRTLHIPVIAGGGIVDGRGIAAALALGAEAVIMGTRFMAADEAPISQNHKDWILASTERSTILAQKSIRNMVRVADNGAARKCLEMESQGATIQELMSVIAGKNGKEAYETGDVDKGLFPLGEGCSLIHDVKPVAQIMEDLIAEMNEALDRLNALNS